MSRSRDFCLNTSVSSSYVLFTSYVFNVHVEYCAGPSRATAGPGKALSRGPITVSLSFLRRDRDAKCAEREETWEGMSHHHPTSGLWECRKLLQRGPGHSPGRKWILSIFEVRKKPSGAPFSVFLSNGGPPNIMGPRKTSPLSPPLDGPGIVCVI